MVVVVVLAARLARGLCGLLKQPKRLCDLLKQLKRSRRRLSAGLRVVVLSRSPRGFVPFIQTSMAFFAIVLSQQNGRNVQSALLRPAHYVERAGGTHTRTCANKESNNKILLALPK